MKLVAYIFLGIGLLFAFIGLGWFYVFVTGSDVTGFTEEWIGPLVFTLIGLIFASIGGGIFTIRENKRRDASYCYAQGESYVR